MDDPGDDAEGRDDDRVKQVTVAELIAIEEAASIAQSNRALTFLAPPDLVLRLVRSHKAVSIGAFVQDIAAEDVEEDLVHRVQRLRKALQIIEWPLRPSGAVTAIAKRALHSDNLADAEMRVEHGRGADDLDAEDEVEDDEEPRTPTVGELWRDALGATYRVLEVEEDKSYSVKVEAVAPVAGWIDIGDLLTHAKPIEPGDS